MKNFIFKLLSSFIILLFTTTLLYADTYYRWKNSEDVFEYGNYVPSEYTQNGFWELEATGMWKYIKPAPTPEEIAEIQRQEEEKRRRERQKAEDQKLLDTYVGGIKDIENNRAGALSDINGNISYLETTLKERKENLKAMEENFEKNKGLISETQLKINLANIDEAKRRIQDAEGNLTGKIAERNAIIKKYDDDLVRYQAIMLRREQGYVLQPESSETEVFPSQVEDNVDQTENNTETQ